MIRLSPIVMAGFLAGCAAQIVPPAPVSRPSVGRVAKPIPATPLPPVPAPAPGAGVASAVAAGLLAGPSLSTLTLDPAQAARALAAFRTSCPALARRTDASGLTRPDDWQAACAAAGTARDTEAVNFFATQFEAVQVGDGKAFATGYYEPEIVGARTRQPGYVPIYGRPRDLIEVDLGQFSDALVGKRIRGRVDGTRFVPYFERGEIEDGAIETRAPIIAWAADPIELFFLQVQGSGRLRLPDGGIVRLGYETQNGRDYTGIGAKLRERGLLSPGQASMQGIIGWLRANPEQGRALMRENKSYVFFREQSGPPQGALGYPVLARASVAADPRFIPLGAPILLSLDRAEASGIWIAQDTGGAIKGANRVDTYWGAGEEARAIAGGMSARGTAWLLLPKGALARNGGSLGGATPQR